MSDTALSEQRDDAESIGSPADRAIFLARLLQQRGIPLGAPWRDALPDLSVRTYNVLVETGFQTLAEVLLALRSDGQEILLRKNFGRKSLDDLWEAIERLAGPGVTGYQASLFESAESPEELLLSVESESQWIEPSLSAYMLARLEAAGVDPENKVQYLKQRLAGDLPAGAKLAMCLDPENHLDGNDLVIDERGRGFRILPYRENDLVFRLQFRESFNLASSDAPLLIRVTLPLFAPLSHQINLSSIADIVSQIECAPIDLRTDAVVAHFTEPVVWPEKLQAHAYRIGQNLPEFVRGYWRMREAIGARQTLAAYHISAALLLGSHPSLRFDEMELAAAYPSEIIARAIGLASRYKMNEEDRQLLTEVLLGTSRLGAESLTGTWLEMPLPEAATLVATTDFLTAHQLPNVLLLLSTLGLFSHPVSELREAAPQVIQHLKERPEDWLAVSELADASLTESQAARIVGLLRDIYPQRRGSNESRMKLHAVWRWR